MNITVDYTTRKMIVLNQIRGFNEEHLIDDMIFTLPSQLSGFNIAIVFAQGDETPIGATTLQMSWISGDLTYVVPAQLTQYNHIKFQILAAHPTTGQIWKSVIGHIYFEEPLSYIGDIPFSELSPYPSWVAAIEQANAATEAATNATENLSLFLVSTSETIEILIQNSEDAIQDTINATDNANQAILDISLISESISNAEIIREQNEQERIQNELDREQTFSDIVIADGLLIGDGEGNISAIPLNTYSLKEYIHFQNSPQKVWTITHNRDSHPSVTVIDSYNNVVYGDIKYLSNNSLEISFTSIFAGKAYII